MKKFFVAGLSYKTAPVALREKHAVAPADQMAAAARIMAHGGLDEIALLWTCNRVEIYGVAEDPAPRIAEMLGCLADGRFARGEGLYCLEDAAAVRHLFSVASGLDSMVLGETEITGQVKAAYEAAHGAKLTGRVLNKVFQKALEVAKEIRTQTGIGRGATSVGSVTAQHALRIFGDALPEKTAMVIGAGKMAEACVRHLAKKGVKEIFIANRSLERADQLAAEFGGTAIPFDQFTRAMQCVDIVIGSTGCPHTIIHRHEVERVMAARPDRALLMIDIAVPRDVAADVGTLPGVQLHDIDSLQATASKNASHRQQDLDLCRTVIETHEQSLQSYLNRVLGGEHTNHANHPVVTGENSLRQFQK